MRVRYATSSSSRWQRVAVRWLAVMLMILASAAAGPGLASAAPEADGDDGPYGAEDMCNLSADSEDFSAISSTPKLPPTENNPVPQAIVYTLCPPDAYYLTYVDGRGVLGTLSEAVTKSGTGVLETAQKTGINSAASSVFVLHAKLVALTINVMLWAFQFDAVALFKGPVEDITEALGENVYERVLPVVWVMAVGYAAWVSIGRNEVANGLRALLKSAVVGFAGLQIILHPLATVEFYNTHINDLTNQVFAMVDKVAQDQATEDNALLPPPVTDTGPHAQDPLSNISRSMWLTYVQMPWARLQISADNYGADEEGRNGIADEFSPDVLRIRHPDDRAAYLCDLSGSDCEGWFGGGAGVGEEPAETTGGETTRIGEGTR